MTRLGPDLRSLGPSFLAHLSLEHCGCYDRHLQIRAAEKERDGSTCLSRVPMVPLRRLEAVHVDPEDTAASPG